MSVGVTVGVGTSVGVGVAVGAGGDVGTAVGCEVADARGFCERVGAGGLLGLADACAVGLRSTDALGDVVIVVAGGESTLPFWGRAWWGLRISK